MGADGDIWVYDLELLKKELPEYIDHNGGYISEIYGHKVLVHYEDNQMYDGYCIVCDEFDCHNMEHYDIVQRINKSPALVMHTEVWT